MDIYTSIAGWIGWPAVTAIMLVGGAYGYWILSQRIERLKEKNVDLESRLEQESNFAPDILIQRLTARHKLLSEELERLASEVNPDKEKIKALEAEKDQLITDGFEKIINTINELGDFLEKISPPYKCAFCSKIERHQLKKKIELGGKELHFLLEAKCYGCGGMETIMQSRISKAQS